MLRFDAPRISVVTHPREVLPAAQSDDWTVASVAEAFRTRLLAQSQPLGLHPSGDG